MRWFLIVVPLLFLTISVPSLTQPAQAQSELIFYEGFEGDLSQWSEGGRSDGCCRHSISPETDLVRSGQGALKFDHRRGDQEIHFGHRAEISTKQADLQPDGEYWIGFSTHVPSDWSTESEDWLLAFQLHGQRDADQGDQFRSPPLALQVRNGEWRVTVRANANQVGDNGTVSTYDVPLTKGGWSDWAFHVKFNPGGSGFVRSYLNGSLVAEHSGPTGFNDAVGPYVKMGIYRSPSGGPTTRVLYHDELRIADGSGSLELVSPQGSEVQPTTTSTTMSSTTTVVEPSTTIESESSTSTVGQGESTTTTEADNGGELAPGPGCSPAV